MTAFAADRLGITPEQREDSCFDADRCTARILSHFQCESLDRFGLEPSSAAVKALGCLLDYLYATQMTGLSRLDRLEIYTDAQYMRMDLNTRRNLELTETMRNKEKRGSLLGVLDQTKTAMGKRLIRTWIEQPLLKPAAILRRQNAVEELYGSAMLRDELSELLGSVYDLERIMTRIVYGSANAKELRSLAQTIRHTAPLRERLEGVRSALLQEVREGIDPLTDVQELIERAIVDDPPFSVREGGMIRAGFNEEIDTLNFEMTDGKGVIARVEAEEKERTGIKGLKVGYNRVFGYYIEISRSYTGEIPENYIRKQTLATAERYITQELKELETRVLGAKERVIALEYQVFTDVRLRVAAELHRIQKTAEAVATLDVLRSLAEVAVRRRYVRPTVDTADRIIISGGRHPVVESLQSAPFVPNDTLLSGAEDRVLMITGPNMAGKSTYMRQTALIVLMAQIGSFVPARASLIVFDEIGRGTSTFDGMSIARAVLEYVASPQKLGAKTLFATHYHELTALEGELPGVRNYSVAVKKRGDDITFLRRIVRGPADDSYGIEVAKLAGVPDRVVQRAKEILKETESADPAARPSHPSRPAREEPEDGQLSLLAAAEHPLMERLRELDLNTLTPIEALQTLYSLQQEAKGL